MATEQFIYINAVGDKFYYKDKAMTIRHREDGPAAEWFNGDKAWLVDGSIHRTDGPAFEYVDGSKYWYIEGENLTESQFNKRMNPKPSCEGKVIEVEGVKYKLTRI